MKRPWMPLYIADFLRKTTHLGALESGAYLHLIMDYWQNDGLPDDDKQLARIAKMTDREWKAAKPTLQAFFHDGWKHTKVDEEIAEAIKIAGSNAEKARDAAKKRWAKHNSGKDGALLEAYSEHVASNATNDAPECTLHTSQRKEDLPADAGSSKYAFESGAIRLNQRDFDQWSKAYANLDLAAELLSLSKWASEQGNNWFHALKGALAKRNRDVKAAKQKQAQEPFKWNGGMEGII